MNHNYKKWIKYSALSIVLIITILAISKLTFNSSTDSISEIGKNATGSINIDSISVIDPDLPLDTVLMDSASGPDSGREPSSVEEEEEEEEVQTEEIKGLGHAVAYAPPELIMGSSTIIMAAISKDSLKKIIEDVSIKLMKIDNSLHENDIKNTIRNDEIEIHDKMKVSIIVDDEVIKSYSSTEGAIQSFGNKNTLEWKWQIKPKKPSRKTFISFVFYYIDEKDNLPKEVFSKEINVSVSIDARSFFDKWIDFLYDDVKTLLTVIIIPLLTFLYGIFRGKKQQIAKKKNS